MLGCAIHATSFQVCRSLHRRYYKTRRQDAYPTDILDIIGNKLSDKGSAYKSRVETRKILKPDNVYCQGSLSGQPSLQPGIYRAIVRNHMIINDLYSVDSSGVLVSILPDHQMSIAVASGTLTFLKTLTFLHWKGVWPMGNTTGDVRHHWIARMGQHVRETIGIACLLVMMVSMHAWSQEKMRWIENNPATIAKGKALFGACGACHGIQGEGRQGIGPRLNSETFLAAASDNFLVRTISQGRSGTTMIPWGAAFKEDDIQSIVAYIRSLNPAPAATLNEAPLNGDAMRGEKLYATICAACHGKSGAGYQETANGTGIGRAAFLDSVSDGFLRYIIKHGKSGTPMRPFDKDSKVAVVNLTDQQVDNVIAHLRSRSW